MKTKKSTPKQVSEPKEEVIVEKTVPTVEEPTPVKKRPFNRIWLLIPLVVLLLSALLYYFRGQIIVATVNGQPITRLELIQELEKQGGKKTLNLLVTRTLIHQEAIKQNVSVSQDEVNAEIQKIEGQVSGQGQSLDQLLAMDNMTRTDLEDQIRLQKLVEKMAAKDVSVSDQDINDYLSKNKEAFPAGTSEEDMKTQAKKQLEDEKKNEAIQTWLKSLEDNAKIEYSLPL